YPGFHLLSETETMCIFCPIPGPFYGDPISSSAGPTPINTIRNSEDVLLPLFIYQSVGLTKNKRLNIESYLPILQGIVVYIGLVKKVLEPGLPVLWKTVLAINRPALGGLERYFTFFLAVGAYGLVHLSWAGVSPVIKSTVTHFNYSCRNCSAA